MNSGISLFPVYLMDFIGAILMIVLSLFAFRFARRLTRLEPKNVLWTYLFWLCMTMVAFAISRSIGHVLRFIFVWSGHQELWVLLAPFSGGLNSITFVAAAVLTFYYNTMHVVIARVQEDAESLKITNDNLEEAQEALNELNRTLEQQVEIRTRDLRMSEQKFRHLFEGSKDMIYFCDARGQICDINDSGIQLLGRQHREEVLGQPLAAFFAEQEKWQQYFAKLSEEGHVQDFEVELRRPDDSHLHLMVTASAIYNEGGEVQGCEGIAKDLTHYREVTNQLIISEKMASVGQLAAGVAHEINTPLGIILGYSQLLAEDLADQPEVFEMLKVIEKQTKTCKRIVADLLKFSRRSLEGSRQPSEINQCLEDVLTIMEHTLNMDQITIQRNMGADLPLVNIDRERLRQVFVNIINNAHHAIGKDGVVGIWSRFNVLDQEVEAIIGDNGPGIPPEIIGQIFDPFFTTKEVGRGTGMGLSVSFGIVNDEGGRLKAVSPPQDPKLLAAGMHTAFHIYLPALPPT